MAARHGKEEPERNNMVMFTVGRNPKVKSKWAILADGEIFAGPSGYPLKFAYYKSRREAEGVLHRGEHLQIFVLRGNGGSVRMDGLVIEDDCGNKLCNRSRGAQPSIGIASSKVVVRPPNASKV